MIRKDNEDEDDERIGIESEIVRQTKTVTVKLINY